MKSRIPKINPDMCGRDKAALLLFPGVAEVVDPGELDDDVVEPVRFASTWKFSKLLEPVSTALIAKTMPAAQWPVWAQWTHTGAVSLTMMLNVGKLSVWLASTGMLGIQHESRGTWSNENTYNPESKPPAFGWQGSEKVDWVTVWFLGWNSNKIVSPIPAVMFWGSNLNRPSAPTVTLCWTAGAIVGARNLLTEVYNMSRGGVLTNWAEITGVCAGQDRCTIRKCGCSCSKGLGWWSAERWKCRVVQRCTGVGHEVVKWHGAIRRRINSKNHSCIRTGHES